MNAASQLYNLVAAQWDDTCGGGGTRRSLLAHQIHAEITEVWWSSARDYKNAVTNELFLLTSASGYLRTGNQDYLTNAKNVRVPADPIRAFLTDLRRPGHGVRAFIVDRETRY